MKRVILALFGACSIIGVNAYGAEPFGFGIKVSGTNHLMQGLDKIQNGEARNINLGLVASAYGEYAFHDNVGVALEAGYFIGKAGSYGLKGNDKDTYKFKLQAIKAYPLVKFYPMGREEEEGIFNLYVGAEVFMPFKAEHSKNDDKATEIKKDQLNTIGVGAVVGGGYDFPFGLLLDARFGYGFMGLFKKDSAFKKSDLKIADDKDNLKLIHIDLSLGYNFATLMQ